MKQQNFRKKQKKHPLFFLCVLCGSINKSCIRTQITLALLFPSLPLLPATAQTSNPLKITVNSNQDEIKPDENLTLREAISFTNGTLSTDKLSPSEKTQIQPASTNSRIEFNLPTGQTTIQLNEVLPSITSPGVTIDGATQPGYDVSEPKNATSYIPPLPTRPVVAITPNIQKEVIRLRVPNNIYYALDKDFISSESGKVLDKILVVMQQYPTIVIELQGHTDSRANDAYNQDLAFRRARNARNYLIKKGIAPERMTLRSFGETKLKAPGADRVEHAYNRRVEVMFFDVRGMEIILEQQDEDLQIEK